MRITSRMEFLCDERDSPDKDPVSEPVKCTWEARVHDAPAVAAVPAVATVPVVLPADADLTEAGCKYTRFLFNLLLNFYSANRIIKIKQTDIATTSFFETII